MMASDRRLIEEWLPISEIGIESGRERAPLTPYPAPNRLHTWWARRPLMISRAAVLASILPYDADRKEISHILGIHGDPIKARQLLDDARKEKKLVKNPYDYKKAFTYLPNSKERDWINDIIGRDLETVLVLDPTAGGGSIPLESYRLGCSTLANDLNPVATLILRATISWPSEFGDKLFDEFQSLYDRFIVKITPRYVDMFPSVSKTPPLMDVYGYESSNLLENSEEPGTFSNPHGYLWARTIPCPYCSGLVPLSPNWRVAPNGTGVQLQPYLSDGPGSKGRICTFKIVKSMEEQSGGTVLRGDGTCPYPDCKRIISGDEIKATARSGNMKEQLYVVAYKKRIITRTKTGKSREKWVKEYRTPEPQDDNNEFIKTKLEKKLQEWDVYDIVPGERFPKGNDNRPTQYGMPLWRDLFSPRQLLCHGTSVEVFRELYDEDKKNNNLTDIHKAAYGYLAIALDSFINYNSRLTTWHANRTVVGPTFARHDYGFAWSYAEMAPMSVGLGYEWVFNKTAKCIKELVEMAGSSPYATLDQNITKKTKLDITCKSGDNLDHIDDSTVDVIVMDPPYYDNVMYAELSDFFYVWLKRTAGIVFPELFKRNLTDKENEAVASPVKFAGQKKARFLAHQDYEDRMSMIFKECRRVLKSSGIMTVIFMHKSTGAWDALTKSIIKAGFYITASWPINSEARGSLHIRDKAAAKSNILLACRPRQERDTISYWEDIEPKVRKSVRGRIDEYAQAGMRGVDVYLSAFGPALEEFSRNWPIQRSAPRRDGIGNDPYSVTPEDALMAARREVKQWKLDKLIRSTPNKDLDPTTAFFVLAWDAFESPKFPYDEALHLAKAVDVDLDKDVVGKFAKKEGEYLVLWDSQKRNANKTREIHNKLYGKIDALHNAAYIGRNSGATAAIKYIESEHLDKDDSFIGALEAVLEVLPPSANHTKIELKGDVASASNDFDALFDICRLKFSNKIDEPNQLKLLM